MKCSSWNPPDRPGSQIPGRASPSAAPQLYGNGAAGEEGRERSCHCSRGRAFGGHQCYSWECSMVSTRPQRTVISALYTSGRQEEVSFLTSNGSFVILLQSRTYSSNVGFGIENRHSTATHRHQYRQI